MKNRNYLLAIIANIALAISCLFVSNIDGLRVVSIIQLVLNTYYYLKGNKKFLTVGLVFFLLLFLFHSSRFVFLEDYGFGRIENDVILLSYKLVTCCISSVCAGYFISRFKNKKLDVSVSSVELSDKDLLLLRRISTYLFIFTLIPFLYVDITRLLHTMAFGYAGDLYSIGERDLFFRYFDPISHLFRPAVILLMVSYCRTPRVATRILVWFCIYSFFMMLSGARITALVYMLSIVVVYVRFVLTRIKKSQFVMIIVVALLIFSILPVLSTMRISGVGRAEYVEATDVVEEAGGGFKSAIMEFGGSQLSVIYSMMITSDFNYGRTYLASLWCISPKLPSFLDKTNLAYTLTFPNDSTWGGSCIGEAYYNFGWLAILFFFIVGLLVGGLEHFLCHVNRSNLITIIFCLVLIPGLFTWVRDFFMIFVFTGFWIPIIFKFVMNKRQ